MTAVAADGRPVLDGAVQDLARGAAGWSAVPLTERIALLDRLMPRVLAEADPMVAAAAAAKGYRRRLILGGRGLDRRPVGARPERQRLPARPTAHRRRRIQPLPGRAVREHGGRTVVDVFPATSWDRLLLNGFGAQVRMLPGVTPEQVRDRAAGQYRGAPGDPAVALVLGAGNVAAITALDILHKLYAEGQVVIAKMNPVNAYLRPHFEQIFAEFIGRGWLRFVDGGAAEGSYLAHHPDVDEIHVTGSDRTARRPRVGHRRAGRRAPPRRQPADRPSRSPASSAGSAPASWYPARGAPRTSASRPSTSSPAR